MFSRCFCQDRPMIQKTGASPNVRSKSMDLERVPGRKTKRTVAVVKNRFTGPGQSQRHPWALTRTLPVPKYAGGACHSPNGGNPLDRSKNPARRPSSIWRCAREVRAVAGTPGETRMSPCARTRYRVDGGIRRKLKSPGLPRRNPGPP